MELILVVSVCVLAIAAMTWLAWATTMRILSMLEQSHSKNMLMMDDTIALRTLERQKIARESAIITAPSPLPPMPRFGIEGPDPSENGFDLRVGTDMPAG